MTTQRFMSRICESPGRFTFAMLLGALLALPCLLPAAVFAGTDGQRGVIARSSTPVASTALLNKVGVSVVRLEASYAIVATGAQETCTGLGVLVSSQPVAGTTKDYQNLVLTDGNLVSSGLKECGKLNQVGQAALLLRGVQVWPSSEYAGTSNNAGMTALGMLTCSTLLGNTSCTDVPAFTSVSFPVNAVSVASASYTLFPFQSTVEEPYVGLGTASTTVNVGLVKSPAAIYPSKSVSAQDNFKDYLTPAAVPDPPGSSASTSAGQPSVNQANMIEGGTPEFGAQGQLVGIWLNNGEGGMVALQQNMLSPIFAGKNLPLAEPTAGAVQSCTVAACWNSGISAYNQGDYKTAHTYLAQASLLNPQFIAARDFDSLARNQLSTSSPIQGGNSGPPVTPASSVLGNQWLWLALGIIVVVLVLLVGVLLARVRKRRRILAEMAEEVREARRIATEQAVQRQRAQQQAQVPQTACPNCKQPVYLNDTMCPFCRFPLAPTASGMGVRLMGNSPLVTSPLPPAAMISEQPTQLIPPNSPMPSFADFDDATLKPQSMQAHEDVTQEVQQLHGRNLSLAVGTRSDPGIKRKHKPNEDSLFAMQGARTHNSQPQQFGLFVVADGMGGHANGQDASRLAIQTMIDFMLPKVSNSEQMDDEAFLRLMGDGVQASNQAVHNRNMEAHADMGTTMTAALVVGATAYVANVGDSRTYLYRVGQGLSKVTHDHSVVASLVEAGIIKPDDIYTHPKRNQIYRSLGEKPVVEVDTFRVNLLPGDKLLLCSDGLWDMVRDPLIQDVLGKPTGDPNETGKNLIKAALEGGGEDNVSVIVVQLAEMNERTGITGVQLLAKPETVTIPNLPPI